MFLRLRLQIGDAFETDGLREFVVEFRKFLLLDLVDGAGEFGFFSGEVLLEIIFREKNIRKNVLE